MDTINDWEKEDPEFAFQIASLKADWANNNAKQVKSKEWLMERVLREEFAPPKQEVEQNINMEGVVIYRPSKLKELK